MQVYNEFIEKLKDLVVGEEVNGLMSIVGCDTYNIRLFFGNGIEVRYREEWGDLTLDFRSYGEVHKLTNRSAHFNWGNITDYICNDGAGVRRCIEYLQNGYKHCETGPAYEVYRDIFGENELLLSYYYLDGSYLNKQDWEQKMMVKLYW